MNLEQKEKLDRFISVMRKIFNDKRARLYTYFVSSFNVN